MTTTVVDMTALWTQAMTETGGIITKALELVAQVKAVISEPAPAVPAPAPVIVRRLEQPVLFPDASIVTRTPSGRRPRTIPADRGPRYHRRWQQDEIAQANALFAAGADNAAVARALGRAIGSITSALEKALIFSPNYSPNTARQKAAYEAALRRNLNLKDYAKAEALGVAAPDELAA